MAAKAGAWHTVNPVSLYLEEIAAGGLQLAALALRYFQKTCQTAGKGRGRR